MSVLENTFSRGFAVVVMGLALACGPVDPVQPDGNGAPDVVTTPDTNPPPCEGEDCGNCQSDADCTLQKGDVTVFEFRCHPEQLVCVECLEDNDCGSSGRCHPTTFECVACYADAHCTTGVCAIDGSFCVECLEDDHCKSGHCDANTKTCLGCIDDKECDDSNPCTQDTCGETSCINDVVADGQKCDAGPCTLDDRCVGGICVAGQDDPACDVCDSDDQCLTGEWCAREPGQCGDFEGLCSPKPTDCGISKSTQVCGCDNKTYPSECKAYGSGVNILYKGPCCPEFKCKVGTPLDSDKDGCVDTCSCATTADCGPGDFCASPVCGSLSDVDNVDAPDLGVCKSCKLTGPVCGCDDVYYGTGCLAAQAGVSVPQTSKSDVLDCCKPVDCSAGGIPLDTNDDGCADACVCESPSDCGDKQACIKASCGDETGKCVLCKTQEPFGQEICGCKDGENYESLCDAANAGETVPDDGVCCSTSIVCQDSSSPVDLNKDGCVDACSCKSNNECSDTEFCALPDCAGTVPGVCTPKPTKLDCSKVKKSDVCGCDGELYSSACEANFDGWSVDPENGCLLGPAAEECKDSKLDCKGAGICDKSASGCDVMGVCASVPKGCSKDDPLVCDCNGVTHENVCAAQLVGASIASEGGCACSFDNPCASEGTFCLYADNQCGKSGNGTCASTSIACENVESQPVCGCDNQDYENACQAQKAGVSVKALGSCASLEDKPGKSP